MKDDYSIIDNATLGYLGLVVIACLVLILSFMHVNRERDRALYEKCVETVEKIAKEKMNDKGIVSLPICWNK